jgi:hypothetical protein
MKCKPCDVTDYADKCVFATNKRVINGEEHFFCCEEHADEFERTLREKQ